MWIVVRHRRGAVDDTRHHNHGGVNLDDCRVVNSQFIHYEFIADRA